MTLAETVIEKSSFQALFHINTFKSTLDQYITRSKRLLLGFSLSVKAVTLIFISGRDLAILSTHEGKIGNIDGKTENFNFLLRVNKYKLDSVKQKDP